MAADPTASELQQLTLKYGNSRDRFSDRRIHRQIEDGARATSISAYDAGSDRQKTKKAKEPRKAAIHPASRPASQRSTSCSSNYSDSGAAPTTATEKAGVTDVLRTGRANSRRTGGNSFLRFGSHAVWAKSSPSHSPGAATHCISWRLGRACSRGRKAPCNLCGKGGQVRAVAFLV